jgi:hypothetical protein
LGPDSGDRQHLLAAQPLDTGDLDLLDLKLSALGKIVIREYECAAGDRQRQNARDPSQDRSDAPTPAGLPDLPGFPESIFTGRFRFHGWLPRICIFIKR